MDRAGRAFGKFLLATLLVFGAARSFAQETRPANPSDQMKAIFTAENQGTLCRDGAVRPTVLLGELSRQYSVNFFALPPNDTIGTSTIPERTIPNSIEARAVAWLLEVRLDQPIPGVSNKERDALNSMRSDFATYLRWATSSDPERPYRTSRFEHRTGGRPSDVLLAYFRPILGIQTGVDITLNCVSPPGNIAEGGQQPNRAGGPRREGGHTGPVLTPAIRGQIDDLAVQAGTDSFKKASSATLAFTDNNEAGTTSFAINGVVGLGRRLNADDIIYGFLQYTLNDQETDAVGDDDDGKDIHSISAGVFYRHSLDFGNTVGGTLGFTGYGTFDIRNDAQMLRGRLVYSDITVNLGRGFLCGSQRRLLIFIADCRASAFVEGGTVLDPGRNQDLLDNVDDQYLGVGTEVSLILGPRGPALLRPLSFRATYRAMAILSGRLDNPERLELTLNYAIPLGNPAGGPGLTLGLSRIIGENFETFQREDLWKLALGLKF